MKINTSDARRQLCGSACCRWALLKLDLCSITAILHPRLPLSRSPPEAAREASRRFYLYAPQASRVSATSLSRRQRAGKKRDGESEGKKKKRGEERKKRIENGRRRQRIPSRADGASGYVARSISNFISRGESRGARGISARSLRFLRRARPVHSRGTTATWIISIFAPAKVSRRDYRDATRFHPRRGGNGG